MGKKAVYQCKRCNNTFESREGGGKLFDEYRCVNCDTIEAIALKSINERIHITEISNCKRCNGKLKNDIRPMCTKCKLRDVEVIKVVMFYD